MDDVNFNPKTVHNKIYTNAMKDKFTISLHTILGLQCMDCAD